LLKSIVWGVAMTEPERRCLTVFGEALECVSSQERAAYLDRACGQDSTLRARVEELLQAHQAAGFFLQGNASATFPESLAPDGVSTVPEAVREQVGAVIGPYKLLEQIGEGGFGIVFMAEQQEPLRRKVALKVLKPGMDTRQVVARFEAERQALALMDHPNIAHVFDGGETAAGRPYFVMELVKGVPITRYCDQNELSIHERLELFACVCQAVQHAHQKGIIHRDLKPSNVLVASHDGVPVVKVIDFGIAKATGQSLTDKTLFTHFAQMVGTPLYMSPEQAGMSDLDADTRSDIYSLGVVLYELLTGTTPFDHQRLREVSYDELRRIIREEEPPRPSTRVSTQAQAATTASAQRRSDPKVLSRLFRGELDWIVMKALEKDRNRRYETASAFAADVERYLRDEPVTACPPSTLYRCRKFARRHRAALATATLVILAILSSTVVSIWQAVRTKHAEERALNELEQKKREQQRAEHNFQLADHHRKLAEKNFLAALAAVERYFMIVSEDPRLKARGSEGLRRELLLTAREFYQRFINERSEDESLRAELGRAHMRLGLITELLGKKREAIALFRQAAWIVQPLVRGHVDAPAPQEDLAGCQVHLGRLYEAVGEWGNAESAYKTFRDLAERLAGRFPGQPRYQFYRAYGQANLAALYKDTNRLDKAATAYKQARRIFAQLAKHFPQDSRFPRGLGWTCHNQATLFRDTGNLKEAENSFKQALQIQQDLVRNYREVPDVESDLAQTMHNLGNLHFLQQQFKRAESFYQKALPIREKLAAWHPEVPQYQSELAGTLNGLGQVYARTNRLKDAETSLKRSCDLSEDLVRKHGEVVDYQSEWASGLASLGILHQAMKQFPKAESEYRQARDIFQKLVETQPNVPELARKQAMTEMQLGNCFLLQGKSRDALGWYAQAIQRAEPLLRMNKAEPLTRQCLRNAHWGRSEALTALGRHREALPERDRAIELDDTNEPTFRLGRIITLVRLDLGGRADAERDKLARTADAGVLYELACTYVVSAYMAHKRGEDAQCDDHEARAVQTLKRAVAKGFRDLARMQRDSRLTPLILREDYRKLLEELAGKRER
jgi:serine/threonine protein kinase